MKEDSSVDAPLQGRSRLHTPAAVGFVLITLALRWPGMMESLWNDEIWRTSTRLNPELLRATLFDDVHGFLYNGFMYVWIRVAGESAVSLRVPSLIAGYLAVAVFGSWIARIWDRRLAAWTCAWLLLAPSHVWFSTEAKNIMFTLLFASLLLAAYERSATIGSPRWRIAAVATTVLAICTDFATALFVVPAVFCASLDERGQLTWPRLRGAFITAGAGLSVCAPWLIYKAIHLETMTRYYIRHMDVRELFLLVVNYLPTGNAILPYWPYQPQLAFESERGVFFVCLGIAIGGLLYLGVRAVHARRTEGVGEVWGGWLTLPFFVPLGLVFIFSAILRSLWPEGGHDIYQERNLQVVLFPFAALCCAGALSLRAPALRRIVLAGFFVLPIAADLLMLTAHRKDWTVYKPNPDWRAAATWLDAQPAPTADVILINTNSSAALRYYLPDVQHIGARRSTFPDDLPQIVEHHEPSSLYLVRNPHWDPLYLGPPGRTAPGFQFEKVFDATGVELHRITRSH